MKKFSAETIKRFFGEGNKYFIILVEQGKRKFHG